MIVPARNPAVGFPDASGRGARAARAGGAALRVAFLAGFLMATGISRKDAQAGRHDKPASSPGVGHRHFVGMIERIAIDPDHCGGRPAGSR